MASSGLKKGPCSHAMALFYSHIKCARCHVDPTDVTVLGKVENKGDTGSDRGETPIKKCRKSSHKSPSKKKSGKPSDFQAEMKTMYNKWSERFSRLEALFLAKSFTVPVEPFRAVMWWLLIDPSFHQCRQFPVLPVRSRLPVQFKYRSEGRKESHPAC